MCGIVAYKGAKNCYPILLDGLHRLEYRGYDSAGVACLNKDGNLNVTKRAGKVKQLEESLNSKDIVENCNGLGIAHTRWATHGKPNQVNSHPHQDQSGDIVDGS
jgi:glucosamine--fructose-6-phosphate aminotransferase (isomerizing)